MPRYIHQLDGWPAVLWDAERLMPQLATVRHRQGLLLGRVQAAGFPLRGEATLRSLTDDVVTSSAIEGETLDRDQVRSSLARHLGMDAGGLLPADRHVEGMVEMMLDATQNFDRPLSADRLFGWHASLFPGGRSGLKRIRVAMWRDAAGDPMQVVSGPAGRQRVHYEAPKAEQSAAEMAAFIDWFNRDDKTDLVLKAALAHFRFVTIHPFEDGNGRIGRALADMLLARSEATPQRFYSMSAQIRAERNDYYDILERTQKGGLDITPWCAWFLGCLGRAFDGAETVFAAVLTRTRFWDRHAADSFNVRQHGVLNRLLEGFEGKLTSSKWAKLAKCSQDTAGRDIDDLVRRGILVKDAAGGRSTRYSLVDTP